jgi:hypothetical protein
MRIALVPPVQCSVCYQQNPEQEHIDMESAYDGPILDMNGARLSIDNIVICETCIRAAVGLLPENRARDERIAVLEHELGNTLDYVAKVQTGMASLQDALDQKLNAVLPAAPKRKPVGRGGAVKVPV